MKKLRGKKWIFEVRDLWPDTIAAVGAVKRNSMLYNFLEAMELFFYRNSDLIIVVTKSFKKDLISRGINADKIHVVYNGIDNIFSEKNFFKNRLEIRKELKINEKIVIGYIGTVGMTHDLISMVKNLK